MVRLLGEDLQAVNLQVYLMSIMAVVSMRAPQVVVDHRVPHQCLKTVDYCMLTVAGKSPQHVAKKMRVVECALAIIL